MTLATAVIGHPFCLCRNRGVVWTDQGPTWPQRDWDSVLRIMSGGGLDQLRAVYLVR